MGSSIHIHWILIAVVCGVLYLIFDALRSFALQLSPVRTRQLDLEDTHADVPLQVSLVVGVSATMMIFDEIGVGSAVLRSVLIWGLAVLLWKFALALVPEDTADLILRALLPFSRMSYYLFSPFLFPLRKMLERRERAEQAGDEEEEVTAEEVQAYIDVGEEAGVIEPAQGKLLQSIVDFGDRLAHEIMTPRIDVLTFDARKPIDELAKMFSESKYSRIPIYETSIDQITGIVHIKELYDAILKNGTRTVQELARPPYFVLETKKVSELLREFQSEHLQIAIVVDEYGGTAGIITTEDIIEEIVGEIADEHEDEEATIADLGDGTYLVSGSLRVEDLEEELDADLSGEDYETVAGLIFTTLGHVPKAGEHVNKNGFRFIVERADRRKIYRVRVTKDPDWHPEDEEEEEGE
jgi:CBS domain containing-hemolysin-like protein